ncbi:hypothetical protein DL96DRAFT_1711118 [Flagelloscypha sp. PMI_526]|nr:hypothetical protein DL96DRAFT_1711118 [Flagelloscypha sp. PMI_526]
MSFSPPPGDPTLHSALGGLLVGLVVSVWLFGVYCLQVYAYATAGYQTRDGWWIVGLVWGIFGLEIFHTAEIVCSVYQVLVVNYGHLEVLIDLPMSMRVSTIPLDLMAISIQMFFASRIRTLSKSNLIPGVISVLALARLVFSFGTIIQSIRISPVSKFFDEWGWAPYGMVSVGCVSDITIAVSMSWYLQQSKGVLKRTTEVLNKLILIALEVGIFTMLLGIALLTTMVTMRDTSIWPGIFFVYAKSYSNSLMVSLNARQSLRGQLHVDHTQNFGLSDSTRPSINVFRPTTREVIGVDSLHLTVPSDLIRSLGSSDTIHSPSSPPNDDKKL